MQMKSATFTFTTDGVESVVEQAKVAAAGKDVVVMGANVAQQLLEAGQVDEIVLQIAPILLGRGIRLFDRIGSQQIDLKRTAVIESPLVTHLHFQVL
jgi:dihydrofolate reductase